MTVDLGPFALAGTPPPVEDMATIYAPRRTILDKILIDAAVAAGAELREGFFVEEILRGGDRVTGIQGRHPGGRSMKEQARIVIGADGMRSLVARSVQAPTYQAKPVLTCAYYGYWSGVPLAGAEIYFRPRRMVITFPTNEKLACIYVAWPISEFHTVRAGIAGNFLKTLDLAPRLAERVRQGKQEGRFVGTADVPNFFRKPYGPGWALVGDAGYHKDPYLGQGIMDAFRDVELLVEAIEVGEEVMLPLRAFGPPLADHVGPMSYLQVQTMLDAMMPAGLRNYWKTNFLKDLSDEAIDTLVTCFATVPSVLTAAVIEQFGGAVGRIGEDETAFSPRDQRFNLAIASRWTDPAESEKHRQWTRELWDVMQPFATDAVYINCLPEDEGDRVKALYGAAKYERLVRLKNTYDPTNFFQLNANIKPPV